MVLRGGAGRGNSQRLPRLPRPTMHPSSPQPAGLRCRLPPKKSAETGRQQGGRWQDHVAAGLEGMVGAPEV